MFIHIFMLIVFIGFSQTEVYIYKPNVGVYYKFHKQLQNWVQARKICKNENATLAMPRNVKEYETIHSILLSYPRTMFSGVIDVDSLLLGFHDIFKEGEYITLTGKPIINYYEKWISPEPNNDHNEDCGAILRINYMNDVSCLNPFFFMCEKRKIKDHYPPINLSLTIDPDYILADKLHKYYKLHLNPRNWPDARALCESEGGYLAIITSSEEEKYLSNLFKKHMEFKQNVPNEYYALIGFHDMFEENDYITVFDDNIYDLGYVNWASGQPNNYYNNENCGSMNRDGELNDFPCEDVAVFICEKPSY